MRNLFNFTGTAKRKEYWLIAIALLVVHGAFAAVALSTPTEAMIALWVIVAIVGTIINVAVGVKRTRDMGLHWAWWLAVLVPYAGAVWAIAIGCFPTDHFKNVK